MKRYIEIGLCIVAAFAFSTSANAASISFDDGDSPQGGSISYDGEGGSLTGTGIFLSSIIGVDTPDNSLVSLECEGCVLNFTTGANISEGPGTWVFSPGGEFTITGTAVNGGFGDVATGTLLTGSFTGTPLAGGPLGSIIFGAFGIDTKHPDLLDFYGYGPNQAFDFANTEIGLGSCDNSDNGCFVCGIQNADVTNTVVPIPAAAWLFGSALMGLVAVAKRKQAA